MSDDGFDTANIEAEVRRRFLEAYDRDRAEGAVRELAAYQALFPDHRDLIAAAFKRASAEGSSPESPAQTPRYGHYQVIRQIGSGGHGVVFLAEDTRLKRRVALKVLSGLNARLPLMQARLQREAEAASRLDHPGICPVYEVGEADGAVFVAMRYVEGDTLASLIGRSAARVASDLPSTRGAVMQRVALVEQVARALHVAHESGLVHRDVKPGNVIVTPAGEPVLVDFGVARIEREDVATLTATGELIGTPAYMAPEQLSESAVVDRRVDVYALGVTLYESLTGERPFDGPTRELLYKRIVTAEPPDPGRLNPKIPPDLRTVLRVALEKNPRDRYPTAEAFAEDLRRIREHEPILARPPSRPTRVLRWVRRRPTLAGLLLVMIVGLPVVTWLVAERASNRAVVDAARIEEHISAGYMHLDEGAYDGAVRAFRAAIGERTPAPPEAVGGLALAHVLRREPMAALDLLDRLGRDREFDGVRVLALRSAGRAGDADRVQRGMGEPVTAFAQFIAGWALLGTGARADEDTLRRARAHFEDAIRSSSRKRLPHYNGLAAAARGTRDPALCAKVATAVTELWPDRAGAWMVAGSALQEVDTPRAAEAYREAARIDPALFVAHFNLGIALRRQRDFAGAARAFREAARIAPGNLETKMQLATMLRESGGLREAAAILESVVAADPRHAAAHSDLGFTYNRQERHDDALAVLDTAIRLNPELGPAHFNRASALVAKERFEDAADALTTAARLMPDDPDCRWFLGRIHEEQQDFVAAEAAYRAALERGESAVAYFGLGRSLLRQGRTVTALLPLRKAAHLDGYRDRDVAREIAACEQTLLKSALARARDGRADGVLPLLRMLVDGWTVASRAGDAGHHRRLERVRTHAALQRFREARFLDSLPPAEQKQWVGLWRSVDLLPRVPLDGR